MSGKCDLCGGRAAVHLDGDNWRHKVMTVRLCARHVMEAVAQHAGKRGDSIDAETDPAVERGRAAGRARTPKWEGHE